MPSGGARAGSGRKSYNISEKEKQMLMKVARKRAKETGRSIADILMDAIYNPEDEKTKIVAIKLFYDVVTVRDSHKIVEAHQFDHRVLILPEIKRPKLEEIPQA
uniref:Uncharacterized protein n=1 Tax=viral metagenome TaxID=1070528 RepID=A0A6M3K6D5_9ZZZZ